MKFLFNLFNWIVQKVEQFFFWLFPNFNKAKKISFYAFIEGEWRKIMANLSILETEKVVLTAVPEDARDRSVAVDGLISWVSSDESVATLVVAADGFTATANAVVGAVGSPAIRTVTITASADADRGAGVRVVKGSFDLEVQSPEATQIVITAGTPSPQ